MSPAGPVVLDTGILLAAADADDRSHRDASAVLDERDTDELLLPTPVATEVAWMIGSRLGALTESTFVASVAAGEFRLTEPTTDDWARCAELIAAYADLGLGFVDATVIAVAERLNITTVATIDHRDFRVVRPRHVDAFELIP